MSTLSRLTAVGYGDLVPRTSIGKVFCICVVIISTIYSAMPVSLVGSKFYELYEKHMEKMVVKRVRMVAIVLNGRCVPSELALTRLALRLT